MVERRDCDELLHALRCLETIHFASEAILGISRLLNNLLHKLCAGMAGGDFYRQITAEKCD